MDNDLGDKVKIVIDNMHSMRIGMPILSQQRFVTFTSADYKENKWEKRKRGMVDNMKKSRQRLNTIYRCLLWIPIMFFVLTAICTLSYLLFTEEFYMLTGIACGLAGIPLYYWIWDKVEYKFPINWYDIIVKHKGKIYT